jgi:hypothetical protein
VVPGKTWSGRFGQDWTYFKEGQPGTFLSALNLAACALVSLLVFRRLRGARFSRFWFVLTALFFFAAADEIFRLHESLSHAASRVFGYRSRHQTLRHLDDVAMDLLRWSYAIEDSLKILAGAAILCGVLYPLMVRSSVIPSPSRTSTHLDSYP